MHLIYNYIDEPIVKSSLVMNEKGSQSTISLKTKYDKKHKISTKKKGSRRRSSVKKRHKSKKKL